MYPYILPHIYPHLYSVTAMTNGPSYICVAKGMRSQTKLKRKAQT